MSGPAPLETLYDAAAGPEIPLPPALAEIYGPLRMQLPEGLPYVISNYVQSLDGVVTLDSGKTAGGPISGHNPGDRAVMGILRSIADAVIVGAGTLRSVPRHIWTAEYIYPDLAGDFRDLRSALGKPPHPLNVIVTAGGKLDPGSAVLKQTEVPALIVTTANGAQNIGEASAAIEVVAASGGADVTAQQIVSAVAEATNASLFLLEAGPTLLGQFLAERLVDELFLTVAPQIAGRDDPARRPGLVAGHTFAPEDPLWANLISVRRAGDHLFLRYALPSQLAKQSPLARGL